MDAPIFAPNCDDVAGWPILHAPNSLVKARRVPSARPLGSIPGGPLHCVLVLVLVLRNCAATVSSTGAKNQFQGDDNGHVGRLSA